MSEIMKKVELNCVSEELAHAILTMKDDEQWDMAKSCLAEAYSLIVEAMQENSCKDFEQMSRFTNVLSIFNSYQSYLDLFHKEANREQDYG